MKQSRTKLIIMLVIVINLVFTVSAYKQGLFDRWFADKPKQIINISCADLSLGCSFKIDQQAYTIKSSQAMNTSEPVHLTLTGPAQSVRVSWQMLGMEMGSNYYKMLSDDQQQWRAETMLPICSQQRLDWLLTLEIDQSQILLQTQSRAGK